MMTLGGGSHGDLRGVLPSCISRCPRPTRQSHVDLHYFPKPSLWAQNQTTVSCKFTSFESHLGTV